MHVLCVALLACGAATSALAAKFNLMPNPAPYEPETRIDEIVREYNGQSSLQSGFGGGVRFIVKGSGLSAADASFGGGAQVLVGNQQASVVEYLSSSEQIVFDSPPMDKQALDFHQIKVRAPAVCGHAACIWSPMIPLLVLCLQQDAVSDLPTADFFFGHLPTLVRPATTL